MVRGATTWSTARPAELALGRESSDVLGPKGPGGKSVQRRVFLISAMGLTLAACNKGGQSAPGGDGAVVRPRIAVIPKGTTHEFWKTVHAGAVKASRDRDAEIIWKGPLKEDDLKQQIELVQSFIAQHVSGIVLAPLSDKALVNPVRAAKAAGIPVVVFDSDLQGSEHVSFVATDNVAAGKLAGERMIELLGGKGKVVVLRYQEGSASTMNREKGFIDAVRAHGGLEIVSDNQYGGATTETAFSTSESLLTAQKAADGGVQGVFAPNESTTFGMLLALRKAGLAGKIRFAGFDASEKLVQGVQEGHIDAIVLQDPFKIGELAVATMVKVLRKESFEARIDTGAVLATKANLADAKIQALIKPDLAKWLGP
jgi:ribose transport system substrate-binding protein